MLTSFSSSSRRHFLGQLGALSALAVLPTGIASAKSVKTFGVQLYTLRDVIEKDLTGTLGKLSKLGYTELEGYSTDKGIFYGKSAKEFRQICTDNGLKLISHHVSGGWDEQRAGNTVKLTMLNKWDELCATVVEAGASYIVVPYIPSKDRADLESYQRIADQLNVAGEVANKAGLKLCYHNHDFELKAIEGEVPYDVMLRNTESNLVNFEMDLFWVVKAEQDPVSYFKKYPGRFPLWHVKDLGAETKDTTEVGSGTIDFKAIFQLAKTAGMEHHFVEQDRCPGETIVSVGKSIQYLRDKFSY